MSSHIGLRRILGLFVAVIAGLLATSAPVEAVPAASAPLDLAQYRGKVVYLDFWASWCAPCKQSFGFLQELRMRNSGRDFVILTVNLDRDHDAALAFQRAVGGSLPVFYDPTGALATRFKVSAMPTSVVIGRDGRVRFQHPGYFDNKQAEYAAHVATALSEKP